MHLDRIIPGINMHFRTVVICEISCRAEKYSGHMHQFAHREVYKEGADKEQMYVKDDIDVLGHNRFKGNQTHRQFLHAHDIGLQEISHDDTGKADCAYQKQREIILSKRYIS